METRFTTNATLDEIVALIETRIAEHTRPGLMPFRTVRKNSDYSNSKYERPMVLVFPTSSELDDAGQCVGDDLLGVELAVFVNGPDGEANTNDLIDYADALRSLFLDHDRLENSWDISIGMVEYFSLGSTTEKMASLQLECKASVVRG
ncbi:MAG: hypothetical protein CVV46_06130 [Spirochaetae bacterium HGW-Spirochaetae-2]|nr:MAG: hypothetical protein CVV46_06130 [Spirochaetae bacterium HGW-Spirochaetae-2]